MHPICASLGRSRQQLPYLSRRQQPAGHRPAYLRAVAPLGLLSFRAVLFLSAGCKDGPGDARAATAAECRVVKNGIQMTSPISGKPIVKQTTTPAAIWDGKLYFFCCEVDRDKFVDQPKMYADTVLPPNGRLIDSN